MPCVGDLADERAVVETDFVCVCRVAKELMGKGFFRLGEGAAAGDEEEEGEEKGDSHGGKLSRGCGAVREG